MSVPNSTILPAIRDVGLIYPDSDGEPMGETDFHIAAIILLREGLQDCFRDVSDVYVASDLFLYYVKGDPLARKAPDAMIVRGVGKHFRRSFKTWEENAVPCAIIEITSEKTWRQDVGEKRTVYERIGVVEYFIFDPEGTRLTPRLQGFRLEQGRYLELPLDAEGGCLSDELGLRLVPEGFMIRLIDRKTGQPVLTREERAEQLADEVARLQKELARRPDGKQ